MAEVDEQGRELTDPDEVSGGLAATVQRLEAEVIRLEEENARLRVEHARLRAEREGCSRD